MLAALTALFQALANAAGAYCKWVDFQPLTKRWEYEDEIDRLQNEIEELRASGGNDNNQRADALRLRIEVLHARLKHLPAGRTDD